MQNRDISFPKIALLAIFASTLLLATRGVSQTETVLHSFDGKYGYSPDAGLIFDSSGNLYGSTYQGGAFNYGMIFELVPGADSHWAEKVVRNCNNNGKEGYSPDSSLIFDPAGNLYGTTDYGGAHNAGTVFELARKTGGGWIEKVLHSFSSTGTDGYAPEGGLVFDAAGNLYGTTNYGGTDHSYGTVFELTPSAGGGWAEHVLFSFDGATSGEYPVGGLVLDAGGNLYGVAAAGGSSNYGTVFELTPHSGGIWSEKTVHTFTGANGVSPSGSLTFDAAGNLYGTTGAGGTPGAGTVFKLTPADGGGWSETILYNFLGNSDGAYPASKLVFDTAGNLYGTTVKGGGSGAGGYGTVFELTPMLDGSWTETQLHFFSSGTDGDGNQPVGNLILDGAGNLYGATLYGGTYDLGTVFEVTP
jgi:uncharacterized repeat protein (TIGR03803 family)